MGVVLVLLKSVNTFLFTEYRTAVELTFCNLLSISAFNTAISSMLDKSAIFVQNKFHMKDNYSHEFI